MRASSSLKRTGKLAGILFLVLGLGCLPACGSVDNFMQGCGSGTEFPGMASVKYLDEVLDASGETKGSECSVVDMGTGWNADDPEVKALKERILDASKEGHGFLVETRTEVGLGPYFVFDDVTGDYIMAFEVSEHGGSGYLIDWGKSIAFYKEGPFSYTLKLKEGIAAANK